MRIRVPRFGHQASRYIVAHALATSGYLGIYNLLKLLFVIRLGFGPEYLGWYNAAGAGAYSLMGIPSGLLGRRYGRGRMIRLGGVLLVVGFAANPLAVSMPGRLYPVFPFLMQAITSFGWSLTIVNHVPNLLSAATPETRGQVTYWNQGVRGAGTFVGTLVGGLLPGMFGAILGQSLDQPLPYALAMASAVVLSVGSLATLFTIHGDPVDQAKVEDEGSPARSPFPYLPVALILAFILFRQGSWTTSRAFLNAFMDKELLMATATIGAISSAGQLVGIAASFLTPRLTRRFGDGGVLIGTSVALALSLGILVLAPNALTASIAQISIFIGSAVYLPTLQLFMLEMIAPEWRSMAYGALSMMMGGSFALSSMIGGYMIAGRGYRALYSYGVVLALLATTVIAWIARNRNRILARLAAPPLGKADEPASTE